MVLPLVFLAMVWKAVHVEPKPQPGNAQTLLILPEIKPLKRWFMVIFRLFYGFAEERFTSTLRMQFLTASTPEKLNRNF